MLSSKGRRVETLERVVYRLMGFHASDKVTRPVKSSPVFHARKPQMGGVAGTPYSFMEGYFATSMGLELSVEFISGNNAQANLRSYLTPFPEMRSSVLHVMAHSRLFSIVISGSLHTLFNTMH
jgi:hypothetical protein